MTVLTKLPSRHPVVPHRRLELPESLKDQQVSRGLYTVDRGETFALPVDHIKRKSDWRHRDVWRHDDKHGTYRAGTSFKTFDKYSWHHKTLSYLRDHVDQRIPYWYYNLVLGHDIHVTHHAALYGHHWHAGWADPFTGEVRPSIDPWFNTLFATHWVEHECDLPRCPREFLTIQMLQGLGGFVENLGLLSAGKVTDAFVNVQVGAMTDAAGTGEAAEFNDFNEHEVGTGVTAESNDDTTLVTSSGIALAAGTQVDDGGDPPTHTTVATITADATETWEEHGVFSTTTDSLLDRSLTGGQSVNSSDQVQYTYTGTVNAEA